MPYVSQQFLARSLAALTGHHPLLLFSIPCMTRMGLPTCSSQDDADARAQRYGGGNETALLEEYFRVPSAPENRPYFSPSVGDWVAEGYAARSLQRQRKDKAKRTPTQIFFETGSRGSRAYALKDGIADTVAADRTVMPRGPLPLVAYAAWLYRRSEVATVEELVARVIGEFRLDRDGLIGKVYDASADAISVNGQLADVPLSEERIYETLGATPPPPPPERLSPLPELTASIEATMRAQGVMLAPGIVARVLRAWLVRDIAVLVGAPGTGKTTFAREFARACRSWIPDLRDTEKLLVDPDYDAARLLGYVDLAGEYKRTRFAKQVVFTSEPRLPRIVLLEEWNTAQVEAYLGQILHAVEDDGAVTLPDGSQPRIPLDTLFLATCNSVRDEPETRLPVSRPTKRRATVIEMPNILYEEWKQGGREAIEDAADEYLDYSRKVIANRQEDAPLLDQLRAPLLNQLASVDDLPVLVLDTLLDIVEFLFESDEGRQFMTIGLLVDILEELAYAGDDAAEALGWCVCGKLLQQVTRFSVAEGLAEKAGSLPNAEEIERAVAAMDLRDGTVSQLL